MPFNTLPAELFAEIFDAIVDAPDVGAAACVCATWRDAARRTAAARLQRCAHPSRVYSRLGLPHSPSMLSALGMVWLLEKSVGWPAAKREWQDEFDASFPGMITRLSCKFPWARELCEEGWTTEHAMALALSYTWPNGTCAFCSPAFAASVWITGEALVAAAARQQINSGTMLAPLYAKLDGRSGLTTKDDKSWHTLATERVVGERVRTRSIAIATDGSTRQSIYWAGMPQGQERDAGVVRILPARADASGLHTLVHVGSGLFALPPLASARLLSVDAPGTWRLPWMSASSSSGEVSPATTACPLYSVEVTWV